MCELCSSPYLEWGDFTERFELDEDSLDYYDGPLGGWARCRSCGKDFGFDCSALITDLLWHWRLVPVEDRASTSPARLFGELRSEPGMSWLSVVEDRRVSRTSICRGAWVNSTFVPQLPG